SDVNSWGSPQSGGLLLPAYDPLNHRPVEEWAGAGVDAVAGGEVDGGELVLAEGDACKPEGLVTGGDGKIVGEAVSPHDLQFAEEGDAGGRVVDGRVAWAGEAN